MRFWALDFDPTGNLRILNPEVVLYGTQVLEISENIMGCHWHPVLFSEELKHPIWAQKTRDVYIAAHNIPTDSEKRHCKQSSEPSQHSKHTGFYLGPWSSPLKTAYALKTPHIVAFLTVILLSRFPRGHPIEIPIETFLTLWPWPMTLTYKLNLDILPLDLYTKIQVCMSVRLVVRVVPHTYTDTQNTMSKLLHPTRHRCGV